MQDQPDVRNLSGRSPVESDKQADIDEGHDMRVSVRTLAVLGAGGFAAWALVQPVTLIDSPGGARLSSVSGDVAVATQTLCQIYADTADAVLPSGSGSDAASLADDLVVSQSDEEARASAQAARTLSDATAGSAGASDAMTHARGVLGDIQALARLETQLAATPYDYNETTTAQDRAAVRRGSARLSPVLSQLEADAATLASVCATYAPDTSLRVPVWGAILLLLVGVPLLLTMLAGASSGGSGSSSGRNRGSGSRHFSAADKRTIHARNHGRCARWGCGTRKNLHFDHVRPWSKGGKSTAANGQLLCAKHNLSKGNRRVG